MARPKSLTTSPPPRRAPRESKKRPPATAAAAAHRRVYLLSDSTGNLARHMLVTFLTQFPPNAFEIAMRTFIDTPDKVDAAFAEIGRAPGIVLHATVSPELKQRITRLAGKAKLPACDLTGTFVEFLSRASGLAPTPDRGRLHEVDATYHKRIAAIEFTLAHDDGLGLETLHEADVVLAGVSRTSKSPTCIYLAQQGYKAANVALAVQVEPPAELLAMPRDRVIGLVIDPRQLAEIRTHRQVSWRMADTDYNRSEAVSREVAWSRRLFAHQGWVVLDVTNQAIEETAGRIMERLRQAPGAA